MTQVFTLTIRPSETDPDSASIDVELPCTGGELANRYLAGESSPVERATLMLLQAAEEAGLIDIAGAETDAE